jgi:hypothetical protein
MRQNIEIARMSRVNRIRIQYAMKKSIFYKSVKILNVRSYKNGGL